MRLGPGSTKLLIESLTTTHTRDETSTTHLESFASLPEGSRQVAQLHQAHLNGVVGGQGISVEST